MSAEDGAMYLENVLRGTGDIGAMLGTAIGIKQLDVDKNVVQVESVKARDFQPFQPFQIDRPTLH